MQVEFVGTRLTSYCRQHSNTIKQSCLSYDIARVTHMSGIVLVCVAEPERSQTRSLVLVSQPLQQCVRFSFFCAVATWPGQLPIETWVELTDSLVTLHWQSVSEWSTIKISADIFQNFMVIQRRQMVQAGTIACLLLGCTFNLVAWWHNRSLN